MIEITRPTLLVNETLCRANIQRMMNKATKSGATLRPHFKTHQSKEVGEWFREAGVSAITVSSVQMAEYFADCGWNDITIAFPYNPLEWKSIQKLAENITLNILILSREALEHIKKHISAPLNYWIKIDVGTHRTGVLPENLELISFIATNPGIHHFLGLLAHAGHSYAEMNSAKAQQIFASAVNSMTAIKNQLGESCKISYGDTPTCTLLDSFPGVDELRPGNFAFNDTMQHAFGVCDLSDIAVCMVCPVVSVHEERNEVVIYGGGVHFSKDFVKEEAVKFGTVVRFEEDGWNPTPIGGLVKISQEHGIFRPFDPQQKFEIGELIGVLPVHSCLTADLQGYYLSLSGKKITKLQRAL